MSQEYINFNPALVDYLHTVGLRQHPAQKLLHKKTQTLPQGNMQSSPEVTALIEFLIKLTGARNILELGTFTGYTTLGMALSVPKDGTVVTCEKTADIFKIGEGFWKQAGVFDKIKVQVGNALDSIETYPDNHFDFAFIDADKRNYLNYYEKCLSVVRPGGLILLDNVLWKGKVVDQDSDDKRVPTLRELNEFIHKDKRVSFCLVPISDGLTLVRKNL